MLHPDLDALRRQYNQVLDELEAGNLSYEEALSTVQAMSAVDGAGFVWVIDTETGGFLRATPGESPEECDPGLFAAARIPSAGSSPWASQQDLLRPPASHRPQSRAPEPESYQGGFGDSDEIPEMARRRQSLQKSQQVPKIKLSGVNLPPVVARNKRLLGIVLVLLVVFFVVRGRSSSENEPTIVDSVPSTSPAVPIESTQPPATIPPETSSTLPPAPEPVPTEAELQALALALISGDRAQVAAAIAADLPTKTVALYTARYFGYNATNLQMWFEVPVLVKQRVTVEVSLVDTLSSETLAKKTVRLRRGDDGVWRFVDLINFES